MHHNPNKQTEFKQIVLSPLIKDYQPKTQTKKLKQPVITISASFHSMLLCHLVAKYLRDVFMFVVGGGDPSILCFGLVSSQFNGGQIIQFFLFDFNPNFRIVKVAHIVF